MDTQKTGGFQSGAGGGFQGAFGQAKQAPSPGTPRFLGPPIMGQGPSPQQNQSISNFGNNFTQGLNRMSGFNGQFGGAGGQFPPQMAQQFPQMQQFNQGMGQLQAGGNQFLQQLMSNPFFKALMGGFGGPQPGMPTGGPIGPQPAVNFPTQQTPPTPQPPPPIGAPGGPYSKYGGPQPVPAISPQGMAGTGGTSPQMLGLLMQQLRQAGLMG